MLFISHKLCVAVPEVSLLHLCRVYQQKAHEPLSAGHIARCLFGTGIQVLNCWLAAKVLIRAFKSWSPGVRYLAKRFPALQVLTQFNLHMYIALAGIWLYRFDYQFKLPVNGCL